MNRKVTHTSKRDCIGTHEDDQKFAVICSEENGESVRITYLHHIANIHLLQHLPNSFIRLTPREKPLTKDQWERRVNQIRNK